MTLAGVLWAALLVATLVVGYIMGYRAGRIGALIEAARHFGAFPPPSSPTPRGPQTG